MTMKLFRIVYVTSALLFGASVNAGEWAYGVGASYVSGISDVVDLYEDNFETESSSSVESFSIPIGAGFVSRYEADSGLIFNLGIGPAFVISGDISHTEVPFSATLGYMFARNSDASPYIRVGPIAHYASGDYVESSEAGVLTAVGIEFGRRQGLNFGLEISVDSSSVEFEDLRQSGNRDIDTYDRQLTLFFLF